MGRYSYRTLLLATCLGLALGSGALFTAISWRVQRRAGRELEETRVQLALLQVNRRVQVLLSQAIELNTFARLQVDPDRVTSADFDDLAARLLPTLRRSGDVNYVGAALASTGESFFLRRLPNDSVLLRQCIIVRGAPTFFELGAPAGGAFRPGANRPIHRCDARDRPFYTVAEEARRPAWTPSYEFLGDTTGILRGVSFATPLYARTGKLAAVVESDIETRTLSTFLARLQDQFQGEVFVLEERADGGRRVIAHPRPEVLLDSTGRRPWADASMVTDPGVKGIFALLDKPFRELADRTDRPMRFGTSGARFTGAFTLPVGHDRPNWLVAVTLPESVALADLRRSQRNAILGMIALALLTVVVAGWLSGRLSGPIERLVLDAKGITGDRPAIAVPPNAPKEVFRLAQVYEVLLERARAHQEELQTSNESLQREIEGRRAAMSRSEELELQLLQSQKFEAIGTMAGGIAHDFNNILTAILGSAELLRIDLRPDSPEAESVTTILAAADRAREVVNRILTFSRSDAPERRRIRGSNLVDEAVGLLRAGAPAKVRVTTESPLHGDTIHVDPGQLVQVLLNLGTNAIHAMAPAGGELRVSVRRREAAELNPLPMGLEPGAHVEIVVADSGRGIPQEALGRIFDPFYTTKPPGEGTGLGLSIVYGIVQAHGGAITVTSRIGEGTAFHVFLPAAPDEAPARVPPEDELPRGQGEFVAVVDNDTEILAVAGQMLDHLGYRPRLYHDPGRAMRELGEYGDLPRVMIVDLEMGPPSGEQLARELWARHPDLRIILASGSFGPHTRARASEVGFFSVLTKPYRLQTLAQRVAAALRGT